MPERSTVSQVVQIGVESTPGTAVVCNRRLQSVSISPSVSTDIEMFRPSGNKFHTVQALNKEWSESSIEGQPSYNELQYLFGSLLTTGVVAQVMDGATPTAVYEWTFSPTSDAEDTPKTLTVEKGSTVRAHRTAYGLITELGLDISRSDISLDGSMVSQTLADGVTLNAAGVTSPALVPLVPSGANVYLDAASAGLGTTKLTRVISVNPSVGGRYNPTWFLNSAVPSFTNHVETENDATVEFVVEADAAGMALLANMRAGDTRFMRVEVVGPTVYTNGGFTAGYRLWWDIALKISEVSEFSDEDGVYAIGFTGTFVHDATWGRATRVTLRNTMAAL